MQVNAALADLTFKAKLPELTLDAFASSQADFAKFIVAFTDKWRTVIRAADIEPQ